MFGNTFTTVSVGLVLALSGTAASASNLLEIGGKSAKQTILTIGTAPVKKPKLLKLGALRTNEATLPAAPLTRRERMALRSKHARQRQKQVDTATRSRTRRNQEEKAKKQQVARRINEEVVILGENGEPELQ